MAIVVIEVKEEIGTQDMEIPREEGFLAGQIAPAGTYEDLETHRLVFLPHAGVLPASCNGRVAVYSQKPPTWGEMVKKRRATQEKSALGIARPELHMEECPAPALSTLKKSVRASAKKKLLAA